ncbi:MAG: type II secretion system protein [Erysipelotrichaceae bacterium]|nr:type II secretion system protein [Erysipelotrichaceae bacterium]
MKKDKRGMSLIELVIVIAIMAVLMAVLMPQFLKYVEHSRCSKDEYQAEQIKKVITMAWTIEIINKELDMHPGESITVSYTDGASTFSCASTYPHLEAEMESTITIPFNFLSKAHRGQTFSVKLFCDSDNNYHVEGDPKDPACWSN